MPDVWADYQVIGWVDPDAFLYMGADPAWSPDKEEKSETSPDRERNRCRLCGGSKGEWLKDEWGNVLYDPRTKQRALAVAPQIERGSHAVCARCMRYGRPWEISTHPDRIIRTAQPKSDGEPKKPPKPEPPKVVEKVIPGKGTITVPCQFASLLKD